MFHVFLSDLLMAVRVFRLLMITTVTSTVNTAVMNAGCMRLLRLQVSAIYAPGLPRCHEWWSRARSHGGRGKRGRWGPWVGKGLWNR